MTKSFFVIVPYSPTLIKKEEGIRKNISEISGNILNTKKPEESAASSAEQFEENRTQLEQRISVVEQGLTRVGVRVVQLGTEEVIELFYKIFNPGELDKPIKLA